MSLEILGDGFDLHGGGDDLVFPHHENERAQAEGAGHAFARHWMHSGMVTVGGEKMSKSLGNFTTLADALDRVRPARVPARGAADALPPGRWSSARRSSSAAAKGVERLDALVRARAGAAGVDADARRSTTPTVDALPRRDGRRLRHAGRGGGDVRGSRATPTARSTTATATGAAALVATVRELLGRARARRRRR